MKKHSNFSYHWKVEPGIIPNSFGEILFEKLQNLQSEECMSSLLTFFDPVILQFLIAAIFSVTDSERVETCTNCIDKQALLIFEPNWCIRLHLLRVKSCANEKKCKQWSHNESAPAAAYDMILQFLSPWYQRFFSRVWRGASSAAGRLVFSLRSKTRAAKPREKTFRAGHFLRLDRNRKPRMKSLWHPGYSFSRNKEEKKCLYKVMSPMGRKSKQL